MRRTNWCAWLAAAALVFTSACDTDEASSPTGEETASQCQDGLDNDGDGMTDCDDTGCGSFVFCLSPGLDTVGGEDVPGATQDIGTPPADSQGDAAPPPDGQAQEDVPAATDVAPAEDVPGAEDSTTDTPPGPGVLEVSPSELDLGRTGLCECQQRDITLGNTGGAPLAVSAVTLDGLCSRAYSLTFTTTPAPPLTLGAGEQATVTVGFCPGSAGTFDCTLHVTADGEEHDVPISAQAGGSLHAEETIAVHGGPVDMLFVIDDSGSMCPLQTLLVDSLSALQTELENAGIAVRIGVTSVCADEEDCGTPGILRGDHYPPDRWVTLETWAKLADNLALGCDGGSDAQEAGIEAARQAFSAPLTELSSRACLSDGDCTAPHVCLADLGLCGGFNGGFRRADARLEVVFLSNEEDQSPEDLAVYEAFFLGMACPACVDWLHLHAIVGDAPDGCESMESGISAVAGERYIELANRTGGTVTSVCAGDFDAALTSIGDSATSPRLQHVLAGTPAPESISVAVDGHTCEGGWSYDSESNAIILDPTGDCLPADNESCTVSYDRTCR